MCVTLPFHRSSGRRTIVATPSEKGTTSSEKRTISARSSVHLTIAEGATPRTPPPHRAGATHAFLSALLFAFGGITAAAESTLPELVELGQREAALRALESGADVDARGPDGATALLWAAHKGDRELVAALLEREANPDAANDYGVTPLAAAAVEADAEIIEALLEAGADVEAANAEGQTALMVVARTGRVEAARLLIEHGANVNAHEGFGGQTALMWAAAQKHTDMIRLLVANGADVDARGAAHDWERRVTSEPRIKIMQTGGFTPLLYAAREGFAACVEPLVAGGADVDLSDPYGMTPLVLALYNRQFDTAVALIERGADVNQWDWWGRSPLYLAIELSHSEQPPRRLAGARQEYGSRRRALAARARRERQHALEASAAAAQRARRPRLRRRQPRRARREPRRDGTARRGESER